MRLVVVGFPNSIHLAKAVSMLVGLDWDVHVVPSTDAPWIDDFTHGTIHHLSRNHAPPAETPDRKVVRHAADSGARATPRGEGAALLARLVDELRPDLVHAHELQHAAFLAYEARGLCARPFPPWIVSNWGSDIYFYARDTAQRAACRAVLATANGYWSECARDVAIARAEGFRGTVLPVLPVAGGYDLAAVRALRAPGPASSRTAIAVKGYQHRLGRALTALDALDLCGDLLRDREVVLYAANEPGVLDRARRLAAAHGALLTEMPRVPYEEILRMQGRARVSIGISMSDGISTSFLEALLGGSFPVQSSTACAQEWIIDGEGGFLVDPSDLHGIGRAIRAALVDDALVDRAARVNDRTIDAHLDVDAVRAAIIAGYRRIAAEQGRGRRQEVGS